MISGVRLTTSTPVKPDLWHRVWRFAPGVVLGAYAARILGELIGLPSWAAAVALTAILALAGGWLLSRWRLSQTWPAFILVAYLAYPEADLALGLFVGGVALVTGFELSSFAARAHSNRMVRLGVLLSLTVGFFWLYVRTLAPGVLPADSGELQVVAANLGVAHPPGFPLYVMLGHLWTRLPFGDSPAYRLNLFSAATSTLTLVIIYLTVVLLARRRPLLAGLTAAIALGTATTFWAQATTANIRSLTGLFTALTLYCLVCFGLAVTKREGENGSSRPDRWLVLAALALGLGITLHISLAFLALVSLAYVLLADRALWRTPRRWLWPMMAGLVGLLPLLYLPLRANSGARGASPQLATVSGFLEHALATGFRGDLFYFTDPATFWERLRVMGNILTFQFVPVLLLGMAAGLILLLLRDRLLALLLGGTAIIFTLVAATYRAPQTVEYMMPAYVALVLCLGYALGNLPESTGPSRRLIGAAGQLFAALLLVSAIGQGFHRFPSYDVLHNDTTARDFAGQLLAEAPPDSVILAHWHWVTPLWYLQEVDGLRPDVSVRFVFPEGEPYEATWARRVQAAYETGAPVIATFYDPAAFAGLPPPDPVGEAYLFRHVPNEDLPAGYEPLSLSLGDQLEIVGYRQEMASAAPGEPIVLTFAWRALAEPPDGLALFVHLVGPDGRIYGQDDVPAQARPDGLTLTQLRVMPRPGAPLGTLVWTVGAYTANPLAAVSGGMGAPIGDVIIKPQALPPFTQQPLDRRELSAAQRTMVGYDWDWTLPDRPRLYLHWKLPDGYWTEVRDRQFESPGELYDLPPYRGPWGVATSLWNVPSYSAVDQYVPLGAGMTWAGDPLEGEIYHPGETLTLDQHLHSDRPITRDYVISTRLIGLQPDGKQWAWWDLEDSIPGLGAVPTLKWIGGSRVLSPQQVTVAPEAPAGQALTGALMVYDAFTNRPLPILDERLTAEYGWVPLGEAKVGD